MNTPQERLARLQSELDDLVRRRDRLDAAGQSTDRLDTLIAAKQASLAKLTAVADALERLTRRRAS